MLENEFNEMKKTFANISSIQSERYQRIDMINDTNYEVFSSFCYMFRFIASSIISFGGFAFLISLLTSNDILKPLVFIMIGIFIFILSDFFKVISSPFYEEKSGFFSKVKKKIHNIVYQKNMLKLNDYNRELEVLNDSFLNHFEKNIDKILSFYEHHPYPLGSKEHQALTNNYCDIRQYLDRNRYYDVFKIYKKDREKYCYLEINNLEQHY